MDVLAALEQLQLPEPPAFLRNDFEIDKEIIGRAAASDKAEDQDAFVDVPPSGTYCFRESDVYLQGTPQHNTWKFYGEQTRDRMLAYAVELTGRCGASFAAISMSWTIPSTSGTSQPRRYRPTTSSCTMKRATGNSPPVCTSTAARSQAGAFLRYEAKPNEPEHLRELLRRNERPGAAWRPATSRPTSRRCMTA